ncbi:MAG: J domain-containing protein [Candidatus Obscuribacterales bacterium]|nr:J domain-containing protein [Candidatus Obscuribacterales bacterium]
MNDLENAFLVLGLENRSSPKQVNERFRQLIMVWHPDRFSSAEDKQKAEEELVKINCAKEIVDAQVNKLRPSECTHYKTGSAIRFCNSCKSQFESTTELNSCPEQELMKGQKTFLVFNGNQINRSAASKQKDQFPLIVGGLSTIGMIPVLFVALIGCLLIPWGGFGLLGVAGKLLVFPLVGFLWLIGVANKKTEPRGLSKDNVTNVPEKSQQPVSPEDAGIGLIALVAIPIIVFGGSFLYWNFQVPIVLTIFGVLFVFVVGAVLWKVK